VSLLTDYVDYVNEYARRAVDKPSDDQFEFWKEAAYAVLFSASFEILLFIAYAETHDENEFNSLLEAFTAELARKASPWIAAAFKESIPAGQPRVAAREDDFFLRDAGRRLSSYFAFALTAMSEKGCDIKKARSLGCQKGLEEFFETALAQAASLCHYQGLKERFDQITDYCDMVSLDIQKRIRQQDG
jgi:hypothetical protein